MPLTQHFTAEQGFAFVVPPLKPVQGVGGIRAADCGVCHQAIHAEWQASTHAAALRDIQYQAELHKPSSPRWLCLNCHIPLQNQRRFVVSALRDGDVMRPVLKPNPDFDLALQQEAITCATCHVRPDARGVSQVIGTRKNPLAPHPVKADRAALRRICLRCHDPKGERITPLLVCWFKTQQELQQGPRGGKQDCVDCHMPAVRRRLARDFSVYAPRQTRQHHWVGSGVPKEYGAYASLAARGYHSGLDLRLVSWMRQDPGRLAFSISLTNARAGHWLPTADPERHLLISARLRRADGAAVGEAKTLRIGQVWRWSPRAKKVSDNRLKPGQTRAWSGQLKLPAGAKGLRLEVTALHVKLTSGNAKHMQQTRVSEAYTRGIQQQVRQLWRHYPMATYLHHEVVDLASGQRTRASAERLLLLSAAQQKIPLVERGY